MSRDKNRAASKSRSNSKGRGDRRKRERSQTPAISYTSMARAVSTTKYSGSDSEDRRSRTRSRSPARGATRQKYTANTKRVACKQGKDLKEWTCIKPADVTALAKAEQRRDKAKIRQNIKQIHRNIFNGERTALPPIKCIAHRSRKSTKGCDVAVTPDTG